MKNIALLKNKFGQNIWIDVQGHIGQSIKKKGIYDEAAIFYIEKILPQINKAVCLDIGAHMGNHALVMARHSKMVYCFDPEAENIEFLTKNKEENKLHNIQIFECGLSDKNEDLIFYKDGVGGCSTFSEDLRGENYSTQRLICKIGDEVLKNAGIHHVDFIKIDIEGFEARALFGLKNTIRHSRPIVMMEWNNRVTQNGFKQFDLFNQLFSNYQIYAILHDHRKFYWGTSWYSKLLRFFYRKIISKRNVLGKFNASFNYANILLLPNEKMITTL